MKSPGGRRRRSSGHLEVAMCGHYGNTVSGSPKLYLEGKGIIKKPFNRTRHCAGDTLLKDPNFAKHHPKFTRVRRPDNA